MLTKPNDPLADEVLDEETSNNSIPTTTTSINEIQRAPQQDPMSVSS